MKKVLVVGVGQLGYRHAQSLLSLEVEEFELYLVDRDHKRLDYVESLLKAEEHFGKIKIIKSDEVIKGKDIDLAIVATNSNVRLAVCKELLLYNNVSNIILEKIVFNNPNGFTEFEKLLSIKGVNAWINTPMRTYECFKELKPLLKDKKIKVQVSGSGWGLACNSIHFIDLISFLTDEGIKVLSEIGSVKEIESKRLGFKEYIGTIEALYNNGTELTLTCNEGEFSRLITIDCGSYYIKLCEKDNYYSIMNKATDEKVIKNLNFPFQSQLTAGWAGKVINGENIDLPKYIDVYYFHKLYIEMFLNVSNINKVVKTDFCNIT